MYINKIIVLIIVIKIIGCECWKAIPANQATYAEQSSHVGVGSLREGVMPESFIHSVFKFGWCTPDSLSRQYLRKVVNMSLPTWQDSNTHYIYLLTNKHTQNFYLQCVVMKAYVPRKHLFKYGRLPLYYCQGKIMTIVKNTIIKFEVHEFYFHYRLKLPVFFVFEFYHPPPI